MKGVVMALAGLAGAVGAQVIDNTPTRVQTSLDPKLTYIGTLRPKSIREISTSRWSVGCETIDREYVDYHPVREYLPELGIKRIRLQAGWARCERDPGIYDFGWLDSIIFDAKRRGMDIWLETSYGNESYEGGGTRNLSGGIPTSAKGLAAWDKWVGTMARRYKGYVSDWVVWNEPDNMIKKGRGAEFADFSVRTAEIIKREIPDAKISSLVVFSLTEAVFKPYFDRLQELGKVDLFDYVVYHHYTPNPDSAYADARKIQAFVRTYSKTLKFWQGESGTQSEWCPNGALSQYPWTELTQAKWDTRRMLADLGNNADSLVFSATDLEYRGNIQTGMCRYGLIKTAGAAEGFRVLKVKTAFYAVQNMVSVINDDVDALVDFPCGITHAETPGTYPSYERLANGRTRQVLDPAPVTRTKTVASYGFRDKKTGQIILAVWDKTYVPQNSNEILPVTFTFKTPGFKTPVWVDVITGNAYAIPAEKVKRDGETVTLTDIPVYDAPAFITDRSILTLVKSEELLFREAQELSRKAGAASK